MNTHISPLRGALSAAAVLGLTFAISAAPAPASASTTALVPAKHTPFDRGALFLSTTTDTLPDDQAARFETIAGDPVRRVYYLHNRDLLPLDDVTVSDPGNNGAAIHCGLSGTPAIPTLLPLAWATCSATFTAAPGEHDTTVTASGTVFLFNATVTDEDQAGYTAVVPELSASLSLSPESPGTSQSAASLPANSPTSATVTILNSGSVALTQVAASPQPPLSISGCGQHLDPGESEACTGVLIPAPGQHVSSVTITGTWRWDHPITEQGPEEPQDLSIQTVASTPYTGIPVSSPTPPPPPPSQPPPSPAPPSPSPAIVIPQPQQPTPSPSPTPTPSHRPAPTPTPTQVAAALQQAVSQFKTSRELPLPLKVLVIIIVPVAAAAAGARRIASSRR